MSEHKPPTAYKVDDQELLLGFYKRLLWDRLVPRIPRAITPNTITFIGIGFAVAGAVAAGLAMAGEPWLYALAALFFMVYLTADNVDGPHARRTGQASPLGEFLDHGLDGAASTAILLATCFMLKLDGVLMVALCAVGGLGFSIVFWEQFRTGLLVIPKVSTTEGVTLLAVCLVIVAGFGDPHWARFDLGEWTPGTILVVCILTGYTAACVPPIVRTLRAGHPGWEILTVVSVLVAEAGFVLLGAHAIAPSIAVWLVGGDLTCRIIVLRHRGQRGPILSPQLWGVLAPLGLAAAGVWTADGWAVVALGIVAASYIGTLVRGGGELLARARAGT